MIDKMLVTLDISMYPLSSNYRELIYEFIDKLKNKNLEVRTTKMSTQIFGNYDDVMDLIKSELKEVFTDNEKVVFVIKLAKGYRA